MNGALDAAGAAKRVFAAGAWLDALAVEAGRMRRGTVEIGPLERTAKLVEAHRSDVEWLDDFTHGLLSQMEEMRRAGKTREIDPKRAAALVATAYREQGEWLDDFIKNIVIELSVRRLVAAVAQTMDAWKLSQDDMASIFQVRPETVSEWMQHGVPLERVEAVCDLDVATTKLVQHFKYDRIPEIVRRPSPARGGVSLMDLLKQGDTAKLVEACSDMFRFDRVHA